MGNKTSIVIPARYGSTRLPGKPLAKILGRTMLERVVFTAKNLAKNTKADISVLVATDDERIMEHCKEIEVSSVMTSADCRSGTDRVAEAVRLNGDNADFIINMQGDAPLIPSDFLSAMVESFYNSPCDVITPVTQLSWKDLDFLRDNKKTTPFSGTTATFDRKTGRAFWFSKNIIPAIRNEGKLQKGSNLSPVFRHIGLYGYAAGMLEKYNDMPESIFEKIEGLEQLRLIENGYDLRCVEVDYKDRANMSGVDSPQDVIRTEELLTKHGDPMNNI